MELKDYEKRCLGEVKRCLEALSNYKAKYDSLVATGGNV